MIDQRHNRARYVIGPYGHALTVADLPPRNTRRWVIRRKAELVAAGKAKRGFCYYHRDALRNKLVNDATAHQGGRREVRAFFLTDVEATLRRSSLRPKTSAAGQPYRRSALAFQ